MNKKNLGVGCLEINGKARQYIKQVLDSGRLSYGPFIKKFERKFSRAHGAKFGIMVNSGTSALRIALACLKEVHHWKAGDEIILPAVTFVSTANVIIDQGLKPVFADVDSRTYNIDPKEIKRKITRKTKAIMAVHLFGQPAEMGPIMSLARKHKLKVIEDSCETMYTGYKGRRVGSFGDIACFSTYVAHLIVTGVGGLAITNNKHYAEILRSLANHGRDGIYIGIDDDKNKKGRALAEIVSRRFKFIRPGYSFRVTEFEGALGCAQLETSGRILSKRQTNAKYLIKNLKPFERYLQLPWKPKYSGHAFMMFPLVIKKSLKIKKKELVNYLENKGIETREMLPLINQPFYKKMFKIKPADYPVADWINNYGFYIGCHQKMAKAELDYIIKAFKNYFLSI
ncbi:MAG TPA: DegT/DnrJ/EryC1/StrS family aminotransferase [Patescibacteria group bacterium]|nr:DegT/DnrJ/EryC1/StrS family aminotransferase [Patescibacteria group bacterium]